MGLGRAFLLVEVSLQAAASVRRLGASPAASVRPGLPHDGTYRILCLGESTTAPFYGVVSYVESLGQLLEQRDFGVRFELINAGYVDQHTSFLVQKLPELLAEHDPDMVILMMGINDPLYFDGPESHALPIHWQLRLLRSRAYRLLRIAAQRLSARTGARARGPIDVEHLHRFEARSRKLLQTWRSDGPTPEVERELRSLIPMAREAAPTAGADGKIVDVPGPYLPIYQKAHDWLSRIYLDNGREDAAIALLDNAVERHPEAEYFHRKLAGVYAELGERALADEYFQRSNGLAQRYVLSVTRANYHTAAGMLRDRGIQIVAMQYPLRSLGTLRYLMDDAHDVVFVDNETVFREAVSRDGYDAVFVDRYAGDFGHGTRRGNELIARNLLDTVFKPLFGG